VLLKFVFSNALVDLSSCDTKNSFPDSRLHITQEALGELWWFEGVLYLTYANKQHWQSDEMSSWWSGKT
jgi:hypothetical protein